MGDFYYFIHKIDSFVPLGFGKIPTKPMCTPAKCPYAYFWTRCPCLFFFLSQSQSTFLSLRARTPELATAYRHRPAHPHSHPSSPSPTPVRPPPATSSRAPTWARRTTAGCELVRPVMASRTAPVRSPLPPAFAWATVLRPLDTWRRRRRWPGPT